MEGPISLDLDSMKQASEKSLEEHDFSAFRGTGCGAKTRDNHLFHYSVQT